MRKRTGWILTALVAVVVAGAATAFLSEKGEGDAAKKRERPVLEFSQRDVVSLQPKRLSIELAVPARCRLFRKPTVRAKLQPSQARAVPKVTE